MDNFKQELLFAELMPAVTQITKGRKNLRGQLAADLPAFEVIRKERRRRGVSAYRQGGVIQIHIPAKMSRRQEIAIIPEMIAMVLRREARSRKSDQQLLQIGSELLTQYLPEFEQTPSSINWRNMSERWGSCTTVDRTIRISDRLIGAPEYVLNYIIFHELIHLKIPAHDANFYNYLNRYLLHEKAEAFLAGFELGCESGGSGVLPAVNI